MTSPDLRAVVVELHGPVFEVAQVRARLVGWSESSGSLQWDEPDGSLRVQLTLVPPLPEE